MPLDMLNDNADKARLFRETAIPHLDDLYTVARYLMRNASDADDAVQEAYLRAYRHFHTFNGNAIRPWLMAILRNVCRAEFARRSGVHAVQPEDDAPEQASPLWQEEQEFPEGSLLRHESAGSVRSLVASLPDQFREVLVLRDVEDLSYREIADAIGAPIGTVMSRLARARSMLRAAWRSLETSETSEAGPKRAGQ